MEGRQSSGLALVEGKAPKLQATGPKSCLKQIWARCYSLPGLWMNKAQAYRL